MNDAALLDSLHAALRNPDLAWYTEFHAGESIVAGYLDSLTDPYDGDAIQVPEGWFRYSVVTREGGHALPWMEHWNEYEYSIDHAQISHRSTQFRVDYFAESLIDARFDGALVGHGSSFSRVPD